MWTYAQSGSNWVAKQLTTQISSSTVSGTRTIQFANVNWNKNPTNDSARAAKVSVAAAFPTAANPPSSAPTTPSPDLAPVAGPAVIQPTSCTTHTYLLGGSQNVVLQHGIFSNSCAWTRMANWINQDFSVGTEIIPSLSNFSPLASEGNSLISIVNAQSASSFIFLGHSQGGLVARYAAQQIYPVSPLTVRGILSIDTPHLGANLTANTVADVGALLEKLGLTLFENLGCLTPFDNVGCFLAAALYDVGASILPAIYAGAGDTSWSDLLPGSPFLLSLNSNSEKFKQVGIVGLTDQRFAFARIVSNFIQQCNPEDSCGERAAAEFLTYYYYALWGALALAEFEADTWCEYNGSDDGTPCELPPYLQSLVSGLSTAIGTLDYIDAFYDATIDFPGDGSSDAIVQGPSQYYPYTSAVNYVIPDADSHTGALRSTYVRPRIDSALLNQFQVPQQGTGCQFTLAQLSDSFSSSAGTGTIGLTSGSNCSWSAVSEASWISITASPNGTGNGSVAFSVSANPGATPRQGYIQIGNGSASAQFEVSQAGYQSQCTYNLSVGPTVSAPSGGGTGTVQVTTQQNCVWSAIPSQTWLTISPTTGGTGTGLFTWTAAQNTTSQERSAAINVMGQTLTVLEGSPVGTPSTATIDVSGSPQSTTINPCPPPNSCPQTIPNSGSISLVVQGTTTFTTGYGSGTTAAMMAQNLVSEINATSGTPVTAVLLPSGTGFTIQSVATGSTANYTLTTADTFNTQYFSTPAFTLSSPNTMSGGTN